MALGLARYRDFDHGLADTHEGHVSTLKSAGTTLTFSDRPWRMTASGGRSSQINTARNGFAPGPDGEVNAPLAPDNDGVCNDVFVGTRAAPGSAFPPPQFSASNVAGASASQLDTYLQSMLYNIDPTYTGAGAYKPTTPEQAELYDMIEKGQDGQGGVAWLEQARTMAMGWANIYNSDGQGNPYLSSLTNAGYAAWLDNVVDRSATSAMTLLQFWCSQVQTEIAAGNATPFCAAIVTGTYENGNQYGAPGMAQFARISDNLSELIATNPAAAAQIADSLANTGIPHGVKKVGGHTAPAEQVPGGRSGDNNPLGYNWVTPTLYGNSAPLSQPTIAANGFTEAIGIAVTAVRAAWLQYCAPGSIGPSPVVTTPAVVPPSPDDDLFLVMGGVSAVGLFAWWWLK
jgi:hypothetical protein